MTKLEEWLLFGITFICIWIAALTGNIKFLEAWKKEVYLLPIYLLVIFIVYATVDVLYKVLTLKNCNEAAIELQQQIQEAQKDLQSKGINLNTKEKDKTETS